MSIINSCKITKTCLQKSFLMKKLIILLLYVTIKYECFAATDLTYTAAVVEYKPIEHNSSISYEELCNRNVAEYVEMIRTAAQPLDIVVFPEATITTLTAFNKRQVLINIAINVPITDKTINPCETQNFPEYINDISCAAKQFRVYIVINTVEKAKCTEDIERENENCTEEWNLYNTNIIFDRRGNIIAKYRKFHLFHEPQNCHTKTPELVTFDTDFGVKFATFTCFDVLFEEPGITLVHHGVRHFVYPTMWFAEVPFLTALQVQHMWAAANDVVFLAANANNPLVGSGGSGIYQGLNGHCNMTIVSEGGSKLIIAEVYKDVNNLKNSIDIGEDVEDIDRKGAQMDQFKLLMDTLKTYTSYEIDENLETTYCHKNFCCHFQVELEKEPTQSLNYYRYRAFIFSGVRSFHGPTNGGLEICAIVFCKNHSQESCAQRIVPYSEIEWPVMFKKIEITATYNISKHKMQFPNTLLSSIEPMQSASYEWTTTDVSNGMLERKLKLLAPQNRLLTFGIYGRDYSRDSEPAEVSEYDKIEL